jgi:hypothetical protein
MLGALRYTGVQRKTYGLYYGTLARSLAPVYAFSIIFLSLTAQPWLMCNEAKWLRNDPLIFGHIADRGTETVGFTSIEARAASEYSRLLLKALDGK